MRTHQMQEFPLTQSNRPLHSLHDKIQTPSLSMDTPPKSLVKILIFVQEGARPVSTAGVDSR